MKKRSIGLFFLVLILASSFVISKIDLGDEEYFVYTTYGPGENLNGWVNLSLENERADILLKDNEGNSITLLEWLNSDSAITKGQDYNCSPVSCNPIYSTTGSELDEITLNLNSGQSKSVGFKFVGNIGSVSKFSLEVESDVGASCANQLEIELLDNSEYTIKNMNGTTSRCPHLKDYGCFNESKGTTSYSIGGISSQGRYCQRVYFYDSPGFYLGAYLNRTEGAKDTKIAVYGLENSVEKKFCTLPGTTNYFAEEDSCSIDAWDDFEEGEYYVCVYNDFETDHNTKLIGYSSTENACGYFTGANEAVEKNAYKIYAQGRQYESFGTVNIVDQSHTDTSIKNLVETYLDDVYDKKCDPYCIVPVKVTAMQNQVVKIRPKEIEYSSDGIYQLEKVTDVEMQPAKIVTNGFKQISLNNANFTLPTSFGSIDYDLSLGTEKIIDEDTLTIERGPVITGLYPLETVHSFPTKFTLNVETANNASIVSYDWKIGNFTRTTTFNTLEYAFASPGGSQIPVEVTVSDELGKTTAKIFKVDAISPGTYVSNNLEEMKSRIKKLTDDLAKMPLFEQIVVKNAINLTYLNNKIQDIEAIHLDIQAGSTSSQYSNIVADFVALKIPKEVTELPIATSLTFFPSKTAINLEALEHFHGGTHDSSETSEYLNAIQTEYSSRVNGKISQKEMLAVYDEGIESIASIYDLQLSSKESSLSGLHLIIKNMQGLEFKSDYKETTENNYVNIDLDGSSKIISFASTAGIDYIDLPLFVSPAITDLVIIGEIGEAQDPGIKWALFILVMFFLLLAGLGAYIALQYWYKTKYETYLFKERNYLFNLIQYISDSKKKGMEDKEIWKKLKQKGWTGEQLMYVFKKYVGKRTGMLEIPVDKILSKLFGKKPMPKSTMPGGIPSRPGIIMPASPGSPVGMPPRRPFTRRPGQ